MAEGSNGGGAHWTVETLAIHLGSMIAEVREHVLALIAANDLRYSQRFDAQVAQVNLALASSDKAIAKADVATEKRLDGLNELRGTLTDQQRLLVTRAEFEGKHDALTLRINELDARQKALVTHIEHDGLVARIDDLTNRMNVAEGRRSGSSVGWNYAIGAVGLISLVVAIILKFST